GNGPNRRGFVKTSSAAIVGAGLVGSLSIARSAHGAGADDTIKIALIGCGGRGTGACSQALHTEGKIKLVSMGDAFKDRLEGCLSTLKKEDGLAEKIDVPADKQF